MRAIINSMPDGLAIASIDGIVEYVSPKILEMFSYDSADDFMGRQIFTFINPAYHGKTMHLIGEMLQGHYTGFAEYLMIKKDGEEFYAEINAEILRNACNEATSIIFILRDITVRKRMESIIFNEKEQFKATLLSVGDGVISTDHHGKILILNKVAEKLTGWTQEEAYGRRLEDVFVIIDAISGELCEDPVRRVIETMGFEELSSHPILLSKDGLRTPIENCASPVKNAHGQISGAVLVFRDYTEKKEKQDQIIYLSYYDQLTGIYNRRFFEEELRRLDTPRSLPLTLTMIDVNGLKLTNDAFGHLMGDEVLKKVAEIMKKELRSDDIVARIGGDEFVLLLPKTEEKEAEIIIKRMQEAVSREKVASINLSISSGWDTKNHSDEDIMTVFKKAEDYMYRRKLSESSSMRYKTITVILKTLYEKNKREEKHSKRVSILCEKIGHAMKFSHEHVSELRTAGLMHDIGKIAIGEAILNKSTALDDSEWLEMKRHPEIGYNILKSVNEYNHLAEYVLSHQERWDGKGYPRGLKGTSIPMMARIIAVADAFDAMTGYRPYRIQLNEDEALTEIIQNAGTQFDPEIVTVLCKVLERPNSNGLSVDKA